jgi:hypothetical protein
MLANALETAGLRAQAVRLQAMFSRSMARMREAGMARLRLEALGYDPDET